MPIKKGPISAATWRMLSTSLKLGNVFRQNGFSGSVSYFLELRDNWPEVAAAIEVGLRNAKLSETKLFSMVVGKKAHYLVFGSKGKNRELIYPEKIEPGLENTFLLHATLEAQQSLPGFLLQQDGGWVMLIYLPLGLFFAAFGWMLAGTATPQSPAPLAGFAASMFVVAMGVGVFLSPAVYSWWKRHQLRQALRKIASDASDEVVASIRTSLRGGTAKVL